MLIDGIKVSDSAVIENARVQAGPSFPSTPEVGLMFYLDVPFASHAVGLYVYNGTYWSTGDVTAVTAGIGLLGGGADGDLELSIDGNYVALKSELQSTDNNVTNLTNAHNAHTADNSVHISAAQNILLDGIEGQVSAAEINHLSGVSGNVQGQFGDEATARIAGDSLVQSNLNDEASRATAAEAGLASDLSAEETRATAAEASNANDIAAEIGRSTAAEAALGVRVDNEETARIGSASALQANIDGVVSNHSTDKGDKAVQDTAQDVAIAAKLPLAGGSMSGGLSMSGNSITSVATPVASDDAANKAYVDSLISGLKWKDPIRTVNLIDDQRQVPPVAGIIGDAYIVKGPASAGWVGFTGGDIVQYTGGDITQAAAWTLVESGPLATGDRFIVSGSTLTPAAASFNEGDLVVWDGSAFDVEATGDSESVYVSDPDSLNFGQSFVFSSADSSWTQFTGPSQVGAGVGLAYTGNTLHIGLGAGVKELPSDEVGIDVRPTGGLITTADGTASSTDAAAQLAIKLDDNTLSLSSAGIRVGQSVLDDITQNAADLATETLRATNAEDANQSAHNTEVSARQSGDATVQANLNAVEVARISADANLQADINANKVIADAHAADDARHLTPAQNTLLDGLTPTLTAAELNFVDGVTSGVQGQIDTANTARSLADTTLQSNIDNETSARASGDLAVQSNVDAVVSDLAAHQANFGAHLTAQQNTFLDGIASTVTSVEVNYLDGVTSSIQAQIDAGNSGLSGDISAHTGNGSVHITPAQNTLLDAISNTITGTEINYLDGVSSNIQTQLDSGVSTHTAHAADASIHITAEQNALLDGISSLVSSTEINYVNGLTGNIQVQIDAEIARASSAESVLTANLTSEVSSRSSADSALSSRIDTADAAALAHMNDDSRHLSPSQNTLLDNLTVTYTEVNRLDGITGDVQAQLDSEAAARAAADAVLQADIDSVDADLQSQTSASSILTKLKTVDGAGSGLDADLFDGLGSGSFLKVGAKAVDADKLDNLNSSQFLRSDTADTMSQFLSLSKTPTSALHAANKAYVDQEITDLLGGAPGNLDTLNELAAALNDDANLATTLASDIATKLSKAGGTMTGYVTLHNAPTANNHAATKSYVDTEMLAAITETPKNVTASMSASNGDVLFCDHAGAITVTLPASPAFNTFVEFVMIGSNGTLTVGRNGQKIQGLSENMTVSTADASFKLRYMNTTHGWRVVGA